MYVISVCRSGYAAKKFKEQKHFFFHNCLELAEKRQWIGLYLTIWLIGIELGLETRRTNKISIVLFSPGTWRTRFNGLKLSYTNKRLIGLFCRIEKLSKLRETLFCTILFSPEAQFVINIYSIKLGAVSWCNTVPRKYMVSPSQFQTFYDQLSLIIILWSKSKSKFCTQITAYNLL